MKKLLNILPLFLVLWLAACSTEMDDVKVNAPTIFLREVTDITGTSAVIHADVTLHGGKVAYYLIQYGTSQSSLTETAKYSVTEENLSLELPNLQVNTTYYYQLVVSSGYSEVASDVCSFTTLNPSISLSEATGITGTTAQLHVTLNAEGSTITSCVLRYGTDASSMSNSVLITEQQDEILVNLSSLQINTTYYCELVVIMGQVELKSGLRSFTTLDPMISLSEPLKIDCSSAIFDISLSTGVDANTTCVLMYGNSSTSLTNVQEVKDIKENQQVSLTKLYDSTTYYVQLVVTFGTIEKRSDVKKFTTTALNMQDIISFADSEVKQVCLSNWDNDGDGELSYQEASQVSDLEDKFTGNKYIHSFEELRYFTSLKELTGFSGCNYLENIIIPRQVTSIGPEAFYYCSNLQDIQIPEGVTSIGESAFRFCESLTSIRLPEGLTEIGAWAFDRCENIMNINIPKGISKINEATFSSCKSLTSLELPEGVTEIGSLAFFECSSIKQFVIPDGVRIIGESAFMNMTSLVNMEIPDSVTAIESGAFSSAGFSSLVLPKYLTLIGDACFMFSKLVTITIPDKVKKIGGEAFLNCFNLTSVMILAETPPSIEQNSFYDDASFPIYVPSGSVDAYLSAWPQYASRIKAIP